MAAAHGSRDYRDAEMETTDWQLHDNDEEDVNRAQESSAQTFSNFQRLEGRTKAVYIIIDHRHLSRPMVVVKLLPRAA